MQPGELNDRFNALIGEERQEFFARLLTLRRMLFASWRGAVEAIGLMAAGRECDLEAALAAIEKLADEARKLRTI